MSRNNYSDLTYKIDKYIYPLLDKNEKNVWLYSTVSELLEVIWNNYSAYDYHKEHDFIAYNGLCHEIYKDLKQVDDIGDFKSAMNLRNYFKKNFNVSNDFFDYDDSEEDEEEYWR